MATADVRMNVRIDKATKDEVTEILEKLGLDPSTAIRMFFKQVIAHNGLPFLVTNESARELEILELKQIISQSQQDFDNGDSDDLATVRERFLSKQRRLNE